MPCSSSRPLVLMAALLLLCGGVRAVVLSREYSPVDARRSLHYANATYADADAVASWNCGSSCVANPSLEVAAVVKSDDANDDLAYVGVDDRNTQIVVALRGSRTRQEWFMLWRVEPVLFDPASGCGFDCRVDGGFQKRYLVLRRVIRAAVVEALKSKPGYHVLVTGHSFGAALALLAAVDLQGHVLRVFFVSKPIVSLYTFGMPRVGNRAFAEWAAAVLSRGSHYRVTSGRDPVPRMHPGGSADFQHVPCEVYCANAGPENCRVCEDSVGSDDPECIAHTSEENRIDHFSYFGERISSVAGIDVVFFVQPL
ncbi:hypothetical protein CUR178_02623 [Leishmania enriettii]|uniref:Fungal lipase-type domain-containing protein n=1 Tax=Leishmania enriettii TaxID=5663 RepID=A0A836H8C6_LEIEN|nr:hypothetical protein CUR178_02623 [Leishmania enriettii]